MMTSCPWVEIILEAPSVAEAWKAVFGKLLEQALASPSPVELHHRTVAPDRLLAESAWELWSAYQREAPKTSEVLREWCSGFSSQGRAVLVLDALSLRELPVLLGGGEARGVLPTEVRVTGSEAPSDTDRFAGALAAPSRSSLANNGAPAGFALFDSPFYTDVLSLPFEDSVPGIPHEPNLFVWHTWLDDLIHFHKKQPDQIYQLASAALQDDGFWKFVDRLRQGRKLVITSDHGYAVSRLFAMEEQDLAVIEALRETFGASRRQDASRPWERRFMPPPVVTENGCHVVMGQRKWKVQGGFPHVCHGGLSLLEVAVPWIELEAI